MFWWTSTSLQHRLNRRFGIKAPVHQKFFVPESMLWLISTSLQHRLNRRFRIKTPVHWMYFVPERLFELISEPLQHRLNRCPYGACTGAMMQAWILCQNPNGYNWTQRDRLNRRLKSDTHRFFRCSRFFCSGLPTAMLLFPLYIRTPHGSFQLPLTP